MDMSEFPGTSGFKTATQPPNLPNNQAGFPLEQLSAPGLGESISLIILHMLYHLS